MRRREAGVTLIEMLVVVTIIALTTTLIGCICMIDRREVAKEAAARLQINNFEQALVQYKLDTGAFPTTEQGLEALRSGLANKTPYLTKEIPLDPWGHPYVYKFPGEHGNQPDIVSYGPDGRVGGDDIVSWKN